MKQFDWYLTRARSELIPWVLSRIPRQPIGIYAISGVIGAGASVFVVHDAGRWSAVMSVLMAVTSITFCAMGLLAYRKSKQVIGDLSVPNDRCAAQAARS